MPNPGPSSPDLAAIFQPGGILSRAHPHYEPRPGQWQMAEAVAAALQSGRHLMVEAGTGIGKTLAYLIPAALSGLKVVVSAGTKTLLDQILERDLPFLAGALGIRVRGVAMKGRDNYLCVRRFEEFDREPLFPSIADVAPFSAVRDWAGVTEVGDRAEVSDLPDDAGFWRSINARGDTCTGTRCEAYDACFLTRLKRRAAEAQIVVVNHHLFFADLALRRDAFGRILPDHDRVIFDEAHLIEETATQYFGQTISSLRFEELAAAAERVLGAGATGERHGFVRESERKAQGKTRRREGSRSGGRGGGIAEADAVRHAAERLFSIVRDAAPNREGSWDGRLRRSEEPGGAARGPARFRFSPSRAEGIEPAREAVAAALDALVAAVTPRTAQSEDALLVERRAEDLSASMREILEASEDESVIWAEMRGRGAFLGASPVDVSGFLAEMLFDRTPGVVLTSATLTVRDEFSFARERIGLADADELVVPSPFDHERQAVLYLPEMPDPGNPEFLPRFLDEAVELIEITRGRAFLLFTSFANLRRVAEELPRRIEWPVLVQGEGSKAALLDRFRSTPGAVLLGAASFWQGVDVQGEALSLVVVDRLPFDVPADPLVAARVERIRRQGGSPFPQYQLPAAVLDLKQGLGRLIRSRRDTGVLAVLDGRLRRRSYGRVFLESLPPFPVVDSLDQVRRFYAAAVRGSRAFSQEREGA